MTRRFLLLFLLLSGLALAQNRVYELRTYTCYDGKLEALKARFRDHTIAIFKRHGMSKNTLIYILAHPSLAAAQKNWDAFRADPEWVKAKAESEAAGPIVQKTESVYMTPTAFSMLK
jgi:hypothetical protein